jgi:ATP/maltotriose-dependent transcriptional regulator MalT
MRVGKALIGTLPGGGFSIALHRAPLVSDFTDREDAILNILAPYIQNFYSLFAKIAKLSCVVSTKEEIAEHFGSLTHREVEVAALLCQGLTFAGIATCLFISKRTVETHIVHLYDKLNVHDKRTAIERLRSQE